MIHEEVYLSGMDGEPTIFSFDEPDHLAMLVGWRAMMGSWYSPRSLRYWTTGNIDENRHSKLKGMSSVTFAWQCTMIGHLLASGRLQRVPGSPVLKPAKREAIRFPSAHYLSDQLNRSESQGSFPLVSASPNLRIGSSARSALSRFDMDTRELVA